MDKPVCCFSEGMITLPDGYYERTLNILSDKQGALPPVTLSRDVLGDHIDAEEYISSQLDLLKKKIKGWKQRPYETTILGDNLTTGVMVTYEFERPDNSRLYQKQAIFTLSREDLLIFSMSRASPLSIDDEQRFIAILRSFRPHACRGAQPEYTQRTGAILRSDDR